MSENLSKEKMLELLADQAVFGLSEKELQELRNLEKEYPKLKEDKSFEVAAAAINLSSVKIDKAIPQSLQAKILADADDFVGSKEIAEEEEQQNAVSTAGVVSQAVESNIRQVQFEEPKRPFWQWLTPIFAGIGCVALLLNIWLTYGNQNEVAEKPEKPVVEEPKELSPTEKREQLIASAKDVVKTSWTSPLKDENLKGEVVWSDEKQEGYMTFKGLAQNDIDKETYQLWIFDETQDEKTPIDGGVFDIKKNGEIVVPIDAKLKVKNPAAFAVTVEKPGGVVVSDREKVVALAKV